jgi:hypothetical protein
MRMARPPWSAKLQYASPVGRLDITDRPIQSASAAVLPGHHRLGRAVRGDHNLFFLIMQVLKVWKNSSCVDSLPAIIGYRQSAARQSSDSGRGKPGIVRAIELIRSLVYSSEET